MSKVVVDRQQMDEFIEAAVEALDLLDNVHAYDYPQYYKLQNTLNKLNVENLDE